LAGDLDGFIAKFDINGQRLWSTYYGGKEIDYLYILEIDDHNDIYVSGQTLSEGLAFGTWKEDIYDTSLADYDIIIAKFSSDGTERIWATYYGG
jgi:hypothetical protein